MKRTLLMSLLCIASLSFAQNQFTNNGFEDWTSNTEHPPVVYDDPTGWGIEACANFNDGPWTCDIFAKKTTDSHTGTYALKMENTVANASSVASSLGDLGVPFTGKPAFMTAYIKTNFEGDDYLEVTFANFDDSFESYSGGELIITEEYADYTKVTIPLVVLDANVIPTAGILFLDIKSDDDEHSVGTYAIIDDIVFDYPTGVEDENELSLSLYPNPVVSTINLSSEVEYSISSVLGTELLTGSSSSIDVSSLEKGTYLLKATDNLGAVNIQKFVKN